MKNQFYEYKEASPEIYAAFVQARLDWEEKSEDDQIEMINRMVRRAASSHFRHIGYARNYHFGPGSDLYGVQYEEYIDEVWALNAESHGNDKFSEANALSLPGRIARFLPYEINRRTPQINAFFQEAFHSWDLATASMTIEDMDSYFEKEIPKQQELYNKKFPFISDIVSEILLRYLGRNFIEKNARSQINHPTDSIDDIFLELEVRASFQPSVDDLLVAEEIKNELFNSLTPKQLKIIQMLDYGYKQHEIARSLGISEAAVSKHVAGIRERLNLLKN